MGECENSGTRIGNSFGMEFAVQKGWENKGEKICWKKNSDADPELRRDNNHENELLDFIAVDHRPLDVARAQEFVSLCGYGIDAAASIQTDRGRSKYSVVRVEF